jgi:uncharacterized membrane protein YdjX (TVP38/TMEM64 family)
MKDLLKVALVLALIFASTFVVMQSTGLVTEEGVKAWFANVQSIDRGWIVGLVMGLLVLDLFIAIPTMTTILLAGFLLGPWLGGAASAAGLMILGSTGYALGRSFGRSILLRLFKDEQRLGQVEMAFARNDLLTLFVCQALPILPELTCTLAGISRMRFIRFAFGYGVGVVPFAFIVAYAGSISTVADPWPAIYTAIGVSSGLLLAWTLLKRRGSMQTHDEDKLRLPSEPGRR